MTASVKSGGTLGAATRNRCGCGCDYAEGPHQDGEEHEVHYDGLGATLNPLLTVCPDELNAVGDGEWEQIELAVDSGASETVVNEDMLKSVMTQDSAASKRGVEYEVANGVRIPNLGEKRFVGTSDEGISRRLTAQVCDVNKALLSVSKVTRSGSRVIFDADGSYIEDKNSGERMHLVEKNGMYMLNLWTKKGF